MSLPTTMDYLEQIYLLVQGKGYARSTDIAARLKVKSYLVTRMIRKLHQAGLVNYERYHCILLTTKGEQLGKNLVDKHETLKEFYRMIGISEEEAHQEIEQIKNYISLPTSYRIAELIIYLKNQNIYGTLSK